MPPGSRRRGLAALRLPGPPPSETHAMISSPPCCVACARAPRAPPHPISTARPACPGVAPPPLTSLTSLSYCSRFASAPSSTPLCVARPQTPAGPKGHASRHCKSYSVHPCILPKSCSGYSPTLPGFSLLPANMPLQPWSFIRCSSTLVCCTSHHPPSTPPPPYPLTHPPTTADPPLWWVLALFGWVPAPPCLGHSLQGAPISCPCRGP